MKLNEKEKKIWKKKFKTVSYAYKRNVNYNQIQIVMYCD